MTFTEAIEAVFKDNDRITRATWNNRSVYVGLDDGKLCIWGFPADGVWHPWVICEQDYFAVDWQVLVDA